MNAEPQLTHRAAWPAWARRYMRDFLGASALYTVVVLGAGWLVHNVDMPLGPRILLGAAPLAPALLMLRAYVIALRAMDEFQRRLQSEAIVIAAGLTGFAAFSWGFMEEWAGLPRIGVVWVFPAMIVAWGLASVVVGRRYR